MTSEEYEKWAKDNGHFISKVIIRFSFGRFGGIYILNAYKFNYIPRFYFMNSKYFIEGGVSWLGYIFEYQWNR